MATRVFEYGCLPPTEGADLIEEQFRAAHLYQHKLVEIERRRRTKVQEAQAALDGNITALNATIDRLGAEIDELRGALNKANQRVRKRAPKDPTTVARIKELQAEKKTARAARHVCKEQLREDAVLKAKYAEIDEAAHKEVREARADTKETKLRSGEEGRTVRLYWGTYLIVEAAVRQACKPQPFKPGQVPTPWVERPAFWKWGRTGHLSILLMKGRPVATLFGRDTQIQIAPVSPDAWAHPSRGERRRLARTTVKLRVGGDGQKPRWATLPVVIHRPLPENGRAKSVHLIRTRVADRYEWKLLIAVQTSDPVPVSSSTMDVGIDIGWRLRDTGIRIGYWDDGVNHGEYVVPSDLLSHLSHVDSLKSIRDRNFAPIRDELIAWIRNRDPELPELPEWFMERTRFLAQSKSCRKLAMTVVLWRTRRFDGDEIFNKLEVWRKQEQHLWTWERHEHTRALRHRREIYRGWAADLVSRFGTVFLEKFNISDVARRSTTPEDEQDNRNGTAHKQRQYVAVSTFRQAILSATSSRGCNVALVNPANTTRTCHACGYTEAFNAAENLMHTCGACGLIWDQDANAARNIRERGRAEVWLQLVRS